MNLKRTLSTLFFVTLITIAFGQNATKADSLLDKKGTDTIEYRYSTGASTLMVSNFFPEPADYYLLTYGYQLTPKDRIFVEFNTWKFGKPLGYTYLATSTDLIKTTGEYFNEKNVIVDSSSYSKNERNIGELLKI